MYIGLRTSFDILDETSDNKLFDIIFSFSRWDPRKLICTIVEYRWLRRTIFYKSRVIKDKPKKFFNLFSEIFLSISDKEKCSNIILFIFIDFPGIIFECPMFMYFSYKILVDVRMITKKRT